MNPLSNRFSSIMGDFEKILSLEFGQGFDEVPREQMQLFNERFDISNSYRRMIRVSIREES